MTENETQLIKITMELVSHHKFMTKPDRSLTPTDGTTYRKLLDELELAADEMMATKLRS